MKISRMNKDSEIECGYGFYYDLEQYEFNIIENEYQHIKNINKHIINKHENDNLMNCIILTSYIVVFGFIFVI